jgi:hypothetical protein
MMTIESTINENEDPEARHTGCSLAEASCAEAEVILRMSVIANAITAIGRTFDRPSSEMVSASDRRDLVCRWISSPHISTKQ